MVRGLYCCVPSNHNTPGICSDGFEKVLIGTRGPRGAFLDGGEMARPPPAQASLSSPTYNAMSAQSIESRHDAFRRVSRPDSRTRTQPYSDTLLPSEVLFITAYARAAASQTALIENSTL